MCAVKKDDYIKRGIGLYDNIFHTDYAVVSINFSGCI